MRRLAFLGKRTLAYLVVSLALVLLINATSGLPLRPGETTVVVLGVFTVGALLEGAVRYVQGRLKLKPRYVVAAGLAAGVLVAALYWTLSLEQPAYHAAEEAGAAAVEAAADRRNVLEEILTTGTAILSQSDDEDPRFGLTSYLLLGTAPATPADTARYIAAVEAFRSIGDAHELARRFYSPEVLNIAYVPLVPRITAPLRSLSAEVVLQSFDYDRSRFFLDYLEHPTLLRRGPYIVSVEVPITHARTAPDEYLFQDLSGVPDHVVRIWVEAFLQQARQPEFWKPDRKDQFVLGLRTLIAQAEPVLPEVQSSLAGLITWLQRPAAAQTLEDSAAAH